MLRSPALLLLALLGDVGRERWTSQLRREGIGRRKGDGGGMRRGEEGEGIGKRRGDEEQTRSGGEGGGGG